KTVFLRNLTPEKALLFMLVGASTGWQISQGASFRRSAKVSLISPSEKLKILQSPPSTVPPVVPEDWAQRFGADNVPLFWNESLTTGKSRQSLIAAQGQVPSWKLRLHAVLSTMDFVQCSENAKVRKHSGLASTKDEEDEPMEPASDNEGSK
ncbi:unnamed protein product, partial [Durusdinium trenchii]